ncbi:MAG: cupin domain-containing protein [bacterium]
MMKDAAYWITKLNLERHPEGGYFRQTYRSRETIAQSALPCRFTADRPISTAIYYLLGADDFSAFHSIKSDELWHFYCGDALTIYTIDQNGKCSHIRLGSDLECGEVFQSVVEAECWFGAAIESGVAAGSISHPSRRSRDVSSHAGFGYSLVGCTVAPGFDFCDFRLADRRELLERYPEHRLIIEKLTR